MSRLTVFGALHHDVVVDAPALPRVDETLVGHAVDYRFGGKGGNQAVAAARMGAQVRMLGRVGSDPAGQVLRTALTQAGVDDSGVQTEPGASGMSVAITLPNGDYGAVIVSGANLSNDGAHGPGPPPQVALIQSEVPAAANRRFACGLPEGCPLIWNAAPARGLDPVLVTRADVLIVNRVEAADLSGQPTPDAAAGALGDATRGDVILTLGAAGLIHVHRGTCTRHKAYPCDVVSTHGAGDMFAGALAARIAAGQDLASAIPFAQMAAALFVSAPIAARATMTAQDVFRALSER